LVTCWRVIRKVCLNFIFFNNNFDIPEDLDYFPCYLIIVLYVQAWYTRSSTSSARAAGSQGWVWAAWPWKPDPDLQDPHPYHELRAWHSLWASVSSMSQFHRFVSLPFTFCGDAPSFHRLRQRLWLSLCKSTMAGS